MSSRGRQHRCPCYHVPKKKFQKIIDLSDSELIIYHRTFKNKNENNKCESISTDNAADSIMLHNNKYTNLISVDVFPTHDYYKIVCPRCKYKCKKAKRLIRNISKINRNDIIGVCDHCRKKLSRGSCTECNKLVKQFIITNDKHKHASQHLNLWFSGTHPLLNISKDEETHIKISRNRIHTDFNLSYLHHNSPVTAAAHETELVESFYSNTLKTKSMVLPLISDRSCHSLPEFSNMIKMVTFVEPTVIIPNTKKHLNSRSPKDLTYIQDNLSFTDPIINHDDFHEITVPKKECTLEAKSELSKECTKLKHKEGTRNCQGILLRKSVRRHLDAKKSLKYDFTYYFPKKLDGDIKRTVIEISSSELIKDTQDMLQARRKQNDKRSKKMTYKGRQNKEYEEKLPGKGKKGDEIMIPGIKIGKIFGHVPIKENKNDLETESKIELMKVTNGQTDKNHPQQKPGNQTEELISNTDKNKQYIVSKYSKYSGAEKKSKREKNKEQIEEKDIQTTKEATNLKNNDVRTLVKDFKDSNEIKKSMKENNTHVTNKKLAKEKIQEQGIKSVNTETKNSLSKSKTNEENAGSDLQRTLKDTAVQTVSNKLSQKDTTQDKIKTYFSKLGRRMEIDKNITSNKETQKTEKEAIYNEKNIMKSDKRNKDIRKPNENKSPAKSGGNEESDKGKVNKLAEEEFKKQLAEQKKLAEFEQKQKIIREAEERKARETAEKKNICLPESKTLVENKPRYKSPSALFSRPERKQEIPTTKDLNIANVKIRKPSTDDLLLQLVKLRETTPRRNVVKDIGDIKTKGLIVKHKGNNKNTKNVDLSISTSLNIESDVDSLRNKVVDTSVTKIIIGQKVFKYKSSSLADKCTGEQVLPIRFFKALHKDDFNNGASDNVTSVIPEKFEGKEFLSVTKGTKPAEHEISKGTIRYALSDRAFIEKGWTLLPTEKVVRKMNVYRMRPAHPEFDWFEHNKSKRIMQYDSGEKLAEFDDNGRGRWFYKNGRVALDYYDAEESNAQQRFVVYSSGEPDERGRSRPFTILATFDYLGNGIVFDHIGKIRLKYNQTEGVVLDRNIGPVSHWKWHTLNDPPVLQQVMIDTQMSLKDPDILKLGGPGDIKNRPDNEEMLAIEFDNFIKEKSKKLTQTFKPFQIKMKALKINEQFSLKVLDQATVYLIFRDGSANLKLNLGMLLDHKEIVDTDTAEVGEVSNSLERLPARTDSIAVLQNDIARAQHIEKLRVDHDRRLRPAIPCDSGDRLIAAISRPIQPPFRTTSKYGSSTSATTVSCACKCRKPLNNLYYETRLL